MEVDRNEHNAGGAKSMSARAYIVKTLTANDVAFWGSDAFISVALALFVVTFIEGATILNVGIGLMIYRVASALSAIPVGRWFDHHRGYLDEVMGLSLACMLSGFTYISLSFANEVWELYLAMFFLGVFSVINLAAWRILFYSNVSQNALGQTVGVYQTMFSIGIGLFLAIGGFTGERFGYDRVLMVGGIIMVFGSTLPLLIRGYLIKK